MSKTTIQNAWSPVRTRDSLSCTLFGHSVKASASGYCPCGEAIFAQGQTTRIRHVVRCFLFGHQYLYTGTRNEHNEYACFICGHPLLLESTADPYENQGSFTKKVRYRCNLFGHTVHTVTERHGLVEYACGCGHNFLLKESGLALIRHPLICLLYGHVVREVNTERSPAEYACHHCGHPFLL